MTVIAADAIVIGAGPAGSAAALELARAGLSVALLERTRFESRRVGEVLAPDVLRPLHQLGVWQRFASEGHLPAQGILSAWGGDEPQCRDYLCHPFGSGWIVDRRRFDASLAQAAADAGARLSLGTAARRCTRLADRWQVETLNDDGHAETISARYIVHATGRARGVRASPRPRLRLDRLIAAIAILRGRTTAPTPERDPRVFVEASRDGWWYSAQLPDDTVSVAFMTDADLLPRDRADAAAHIAQRLTETSLTKWWLQSWTAEPHFARAAADSCWWPVESESGNGSGSEDGASLAVGDALMSIDPLSGDGVVSALDSGRLAAAAILDRERGDDTAIVRSMSALRARFATYQSRRIEHYRLEQRWPTSPFWARRHAHDPI